MTLTVYSQKVLLSVEPGPFLVTKVVVYRVSRWRLLQAIFTGAVKGEWPPKGKPVSDAATPTLRVQP